MHTSARQSALLVAIGVLGCSESYAFSNAAFVPILRANANRPAFLATSLSIRGWKMQASNLVGDRFEDDDKPTIVSINFCGIRPARYARNDCLALGSQKTNFCRNNRTCCWQPGAPYDKRDAAYTKSGQVRTKARIHTYAVADLRTEDLRRCGPPNGRSASIRALETDFVPILYYVINFYTLLAHNVLREPASRRNHARGARELAAGTARHQPPARQQPGVGSEEEGHRP